MLHMAKRPFATVTVFVHGNLCPAGVPPSITVGGRRRRSPDLRPVAIEPTANGHAAITTVLVR